MLSPKVPGITGTTVVWMSVLPRPATHLISLLYWQDQLRAALPRLSLQCAPSPYAFITALPTSPLQWV